MYQAWRSMAFQAEMRARAEALKQAAIKRNVERNRRFKQAASLRETWRDPAKRKAWKQAIANGTRESFKTDKRAKHRAAVSESLMLRWRDPDFRLKVRSAALERAHVRRGYEIPPGAEQIVAKWRRAGLSHAEIAAALARMCRLT